MKPTLYNFQNKIETDILYSMKQGYKSPLVVSPTGSGKTIIFCDIAEKAKAKGKKALIITHRRELYKQTSAALTAIEVKHGLIIPKKPLTADQIQVASVQTLIRRLDKIQTPDIIILDEAHHSPSKTWSRIIDRFPDAYLVGVTATPCRLDGKPLGKEKGGFFDVLIQGPSVKQLIAQGYLSDYVVYRPPLPVDFADVKVKYGDYELTALEEKLNKRSITGDVIEHYKKLSYDSPAIAFCCTVAHAVAVADEFISAGIPASVIDGSMDFKTRDNRIQSLAEGRCKVLCSCDVISEGTDIPIVTTGILLRPTQSMALYLQQVGRCGRIHDQKKHAIILDHVGNSIRHGLPDEERFWSLTENAQKARQKRNTDEGMVLRQCSKCYRVHAVAPVCPYCGYVYKVKDRTPEMIAGDLEVAEKEKAERLRLEQLQFKKDRAKAGSLEELIQVGLRKGMAQHNAVAWAGHVFNGRKLKRERKLG